MTINNFKINTILKKERVESSLDTQMNPLIVPGAGLLLAFIVCKVLGLVNSDSIFATTGFLFVNGALALGGLLAVYFAMLDFLNTSLVITDKRIMFKSGIKRELYSVPLGKIQGIDLKKQLALRPGISLLLTVIFKQEENFINSSRFKITVSKSADMTRLYELVTKIDEQFKFESGGKIETLKISSRKYLAADLALIVLLLFSTLLILV